MIIPQTIKLGKTCYTIAQPLETPKAATRGRIVYDIQLIEIAKRCNVTGRRFSPKERTETFWHEITHGILHDMGHHLAYNEQFVTAFSKRINNALHSAKF